MYTILKVSYYCKIDHKQKNRSKIQEFLNRHLSTVTFQFWLKQYPTFLLGRLELFPDALNFISFIAHFYFAGSDCLISYLFYFSLHLKQSHNQLLCQDYEHHLNMIVHSSNPLAPFSPWSWCSRV